ncbi:hypothetical protein Back2_09730 [Nocardioides baekrokdamisoli]|uniref:Uncharacterized protein n=1 Tax=Nocardioides baekrokdamisoli TaxID=1804624 RepID=A0A3G9IEB7_9ACTN|nr:hypothetical protein [Nocardioides baekrokdamisoli]BBH16686.1 hypothetical protein Back2_09730 [Nocardioides baekrokdamisoli]
MTWTTHHNRGHVLREIEAVTAERGDGLLPMDLDGVSAVFDDEMDILAALQLRWYTRLAGMIERELFDAGDANLEAAVIHAWHLTYDELPGVRAVLDHYNANPTNDVMRQALATGRLKEHHLIALMAGLGGYGHELSIAVGGRLEKRARETYISALHVAEVQERTSILDRVRALVA